MLFALEQKEDEIIQMQEHLPVLLVRKNGVTTVGSGNNVRSYSSIQIILREKVSKGGVYPIRWKSLHVETVHWL